MLFPSNQQVMQSQDEGIAREIQENEQREERMWGHWHRAGDAGEMHQPHKLSAPVRRQVPATVKKIM